MAAAISGVSGTSRKRKFDYFTRAVKNRSADIQDDLTDAQLVSTVMNYSIDPYDFDDEQLFKMAIIIFRYYDILNEFNIQETTLVHFFRIIREMYESDNYFHNFKHAWGVMHMCFHILKSGGEKFLDRFDVFTILIAAVCHDVRHPGNSNAFEVATESFVSKKFSKVNEVCVLERFHAHVTAVILLTEDDVGYNILSSLSQSERERFVQQVDFIILGTDMAKHVLLVSEARSLAALVTSSEIIPLSCHSHSSNVSANSQSSSSQRASARIKSRNSSADEHDDWPSQQSKSPRSPRALPGMISRHIGTHCIANTDTRLLLTRVLVHSADIGAQTQANDVALKWVDRVYSEYRDQAERERNLGIMTSPFLHDLKEDAKVFSTQHSFINDVVEPIWTALSAFIPDLRFAVDQLIANKKHYGALF